MYCNLLKINFVTGPTKQGMWAHKICLLFQTFIAHNFLCHCAVVMQLLACVKHLIDFILKVTEYKYFIPALKYDLLCCGM